MLLIAQENVNMFLNVKQNKIKMKYLFGALLFLYFLLMGAWAYGQNYAISGLWVNQENEFLRIEPGGDFVRFTVVNRKITPITQGEVFEVNKDKIDLVSKKIEKHMVNCITLNVPLVVDIGFGNTWAESH